MKILKCTLLIYLVFSFNKLFSQCEYFVLPINNDADVLNYVNNNDNCKRIGRIEIKNKPNNLNLLFSFLDTIGLIKITNCNLDSIYFPEKLQILYGLDVTKNDSLKTLTILSKNLSEIADIKVIVEENRNLTKVTTTLPEKIVNFYISTDTILNFKILNKFEGYQILSQGRVHYSGERPKCQKFEFYKNNLYKCIDDVNKSFNLDSIDIIQIGLNLDSFSFTGIEKINRINNLALFFINYLDLSNFIKSNFNIKSLSILNCSSVNDLLPFSNCKLRNLSIVGLDNISSLNGIVFDKYSSQLMISSNINLEDISALNSIDSFVFDESGLFVDIVNNPKLNFCSIDPICNLIENKQNAKVNIENNLGFCLNEIEVNRQCLSSSIDIFETIDLDRAVIVTDGLNDLNIYKCIHLFDLQGRLLSSITNSSISANFINNLPSGYYYFRLLDQNNKILIKKIIIL